MYSYLYHERWLPTMRKSSFQVRLSAITASLSSQSYLLQGVMLLEVNPVEKVLERFGWSTQLKSYPAISRLSQQPTT